MVTLSDGGPEKPEADGRRHERPEDVFARADAEAREDDARPEHLAERQRLGHVPIRHRRQIAVPDGIEELPGAVPGGRGHVLIVWGHGGES